MSNVYDIGVIGLGIAGATCVYKMAKEHKRAKIIGIDLGRPPQKRRRQIDGWLGCLPNSDGKLYLSDIAKVAELTGLRKAKSAHTYLKRLLEQIDTFKVIKDCPPSISIEKKLAKLGYEVSLHDYIQMYPKEIHKLSKYLADSIELNTNVTLAFDTEVTRIVKQKGVFLVSTEEQEYHCKKLIIAVGRSGWRWVSELYKSLGLIDNNDEARFGIRIEMDAHYLKHWKKSNCSLTSQDGKVEIGPFSWDGTVIPEDHVDVVISAFRSNEARWKSNKVSFDFIGNLPYPERGYEETDRVSKLTFVLANDRVIKERVSHILTKKSGVSIIPEYNWLIEPLQQLAEVIPEVTSKAYFHVPCIVPLAPKINLGANLESEISGMFIVGESTGVHGILAAGITGLIAADTVYK